MSKSIQLKTSTNEPVYPHPYYPIGSIFLSVVDTNPSQWFGGTWERIAKGRTLVGVDENDTDFNTVKKTAGSKTHYHWLPTFDYNNGMGVLDTSRLHKRSSGITPPQDAGNWLFRISGTTGATSGGQQWGTADGSSLQPYFTVYIWCRTA